MTNYEQWQVDRYGNILPPNGKTAISGSTSTNNPNSTMSDDERMIRMHADALRYLQEIEIARRLKTINPDLAQQCDDQVKKSSLAYAERMTVVVANILMKLNSPSPR